MPQEGPAPELDRFEERKPLMGRLCRGGECVCGEGPELGAGGVIPEGQLVRNTDHRSASSPWERQGMPPHPSVEPEGLLP